MDKEILVGEVLTDSMVEVGDHLLSDIKDSDLQIKGAFWLYFSEADEWRLVLVSPRVDSDGPRKLYEELAHRIYEGSDKAYGLELRNLTVMSSNDTLARTVAGANKLWGDLSGKRLRQVGLNGMYVEDIYIYFIDKSIKPLPGPLWFSK